jgi:hypothetical protein
MNIFSFKLEAPNEGVRAGRLYPLVLVSYGEPGLKGTFANGGMGEGIADRPESEISVLDDSPPGDVTVLLFAAFQPKKELILFPDVFGCLGSPAPIDIDIERESTSICRGGGLCIGICNAILVARRDNRFVGGGELRTGMNGSLSRRLCRGVALMNWCSYSSSK